MSRPPGPHGTRGKYTAGCRCIECADANATYMADWRARNRARGLAPDDPRHGRNTTYLNHGCRCTKCAVAHERAKASAA